MVVRQREYFDLSSFNWILNRPNSWSILGAMNFEKWELFLAYPVVLYSELSESGRIRYFWASG